MSLQQWQADFIACLHDADVPLPRGWGAAMARGLEIHRNNYRHALMEAMRSTFERTLRWVGDASFEAAAAHHLVAHPPSGWTLDDVGAGFARTAATLFAREPEVADLAALEWAMHRVFVAADATALDLAGFRDATAGFEEDDWSGMRLLTLPGIGIVEVGTDCVALWRGLAGDARPPEPSRLARPHAAIVWREGWQPVCCLVDAGEAEPCARPLPARRSAGCAGSSPHATARKARRARPDGCWRGGSRPACWRASNAGARWTGALPRDRPCPCPASCACACCRRLRAPDAQ